MAKSRLPFLIAIAILSAPNFASAQAAGIAATIDAKKTTSGTDAFKGNWIVPKGDYSLKALGGAQIELVDIKAELQYLDGAAWKSLQPQAIQTANTAPPEWWTGGWMKITGGFSYRVSVVMTYRYKINPTDAWTTKETSDNEFQKAF